MFGYTRFTGNFVGICVQDLSGMGKHAGFDYVYYSEDAPELFDADQNSGNIGRNTNKSRIADLLDNSDTAKILKKHHTGIDTHPMFDVIKSLPWINWANLQWQISRTIRFKIASLNCLVIRNKSDLLSLPI
ncbi:hypothetical protein GCM10008013_41260 [Paenibacillus segetis]|uniref:Uncharacterized protein n=2 Tax=Paenibacillus segetis TaxID=1325360 RepID=A0ABQ1YSS5_9BACL|nr:hypothetical protein GCM10008013_41260 [Paenibacillus segetis]